ncbi:hypothetical protein F5Y02DRAFT_372616 [Annulohypoxylon stygium]|nr:hypothetical protein F5Y02DRAFT_372616 [Annulohypoxylon stygium]
MQQDSLVGDELRVYGFDNLRISDASVFLELPLTHSWIALYISLIVKEAWYLR